MMNSLVWLAFLMGLLACSPRPAGTPEQALARAGERSPIEPVTRFMAGHPEYHVLAHSELERRWPRLKPADVRATAEGDTNGDGYGDLAVVFVRDGGGGPTYSVGVFHGTATGFRVAPAWVQRGDRELIAGVDVVDRGVRLWFCYFCDFSATLRWTGDAYEEGIYFPGERACLYLGTTIRSAPSREAPPVFVHKRGIGSVEVVALGERTKRHTRWHEVRLLESVDPASAGVRLPAEPEVSGFVEDTDFADNCG